MSQLLSAPLHAGGSKPRPGRLVLTLALAALASACVEVNAPPIDPDEFTVTPNAGQGALRVELGEQLVLRIEEDLLEDQLVEWSLLPPEAGSLTVSSDMSEATFVAGASPGPVEVTVEVFEDVVSLGTGDVALNLVAPLYEAARRFEYGGAPDYTISGSSVDFHQGTVLVGHSAERVVGMESFGKFATLARYPNSGAARFLDFEGLATVFAAALERPASGGSLADAFALIHDPMSGAGVPAELVRYDANWSRVGAWTDPIGNTFEYAPVIATRGDGVFVAGWDGNQFVVRRLDQAGDESDRWDLSDVAQPEDIRGIAVGPERVFVLTPLNIQAFDLEGPGAEVFMGGSSLPFGMLQDLAGPDGRGRLLACGAGTVYLLSPDAELVHTVTGMDFTEAGGGSLFEGLSGVSVAGDAIRLYDEGFRTDVEGERFVSRVIELEADVPPPTLTISPPGVILNLGWSRMFTVRQNGVPRDGLVLDSVAGGRVQPMGNGRYRYIGGGSIGTFQLALVDDQANPTVRVVSYVTLTAFNFGFDAPTNGPGNSSHDPLTAMASAGEDFVVAYFNGETGDDFLRRFSFDTPFDLGDLSESIEGPFDEPASINVAASPDGTSYWLDRNSGIGTAQLLHRWRKGQAMESFTLEAPDGTPYTGAELTSVIAAGPPVSDPGTHEASLYWVRDESSLPGNGGTTTPFVVYRYDVPISLVDGQAITPITVPVSAPLSAGDAPTDLAVAAGGSVLYTANATCVGRFEVDGGGYTFDPCWQDLAGLVGSIPSLDVGAGDLLHVNGGDRIVVLSADGLDGNGDPIDVLTTYPTPDSGNFGQTRLLQVRDMVVDGSEGRIRLMDEIEAVTDEIAILGVEIESR